MPLHPRTHPSLTHLRHFTNSTPLLAKSTKQRLLAEHASIPPYPYEPSRIYKQSNFGLYGSSVIQFGNNVSEAHNVKTRRHWRPNVHRKRLWSESLNRFVRVRITTRVLRTVDKCGGLDEYLLGEKPRRVKDLGMAGWKLRWRIMQTEAVRERYRRERERLGLPPKEELLFGEDGVVVSKELIQDEVQRYDAELARDAAVDIGEDVEGEVLEGSFMHEDPIPPREKIL